MLQHHLYLHRIETRYLSHKLSQTSFPTEFQLKLFLSIIFQTRNSHYHQTKLTFHKVSFLLDKTSSNH